mmetsp:Transcript_122919/g.241146  ORF Transcript_122919/g.241146 Transcript_122919/m.241146 type:complete len:119 (-) Transcript_122919:788-1144(-)
MQSLWSPTQSKRPFPLWLWASTSLRPKPLGKKSAEFKKLLDCLNIDPPIPTTEVFTDTSMFSTATYEDEGTSTTLRAFSWHWTKRLEEASSYEPFCSYLELHQEGRRKGVQLLHRREG